MLNLSKIIKENKSAFIAISVKGCKHPHIISICASEGCYAAVSGFGCGNPHFTPHLDDDVGKANFAARFLMRKNGHGAKKEERLAFFNNIEAVHILKDAFRATLYLPSIYDTGLNDKWRKLL